MKEIKFRCWDSTNKRMIEWGSMQAWMMGRLNGDRLMQFTGLLDRHGKEIYEGDIVTQHNLRTSRLGEVNSEIVWYQPYGGYAVATLNDNKTGKFIHYLTEEIKLEVIGNIYENEDFIK